MTEKNEISEELDKAMRLIMDILHANKITDLTALNALTNVSLSILLHHGVSYHLLNSIFSTMNDAIISIGGNSFTVKGKCD